jgi:hypothetical protein
MTEQDATMKAKFEEQTKLIREYCYV